MIAKRINDKGKGTSSFGKLIKYISRDQSADVPIKISNCELSDSLALSIREVESTQAMNQRTQKDKCYHLVVSFPLGEKPSEQILDDIESELVGAIGYGEHQRIRAIHDDKDHYHMHIAINKIHPQKYNMIEPYYDKKTLMRSCAELELKHGLMRVNHGHGEEKSQGAAADIESHRGIESLQTWVKQNAKQELMKADNWQSFNTVLAKYGLHCKQRGAGLVIGNDDGIYIKSSSIDKSFGFKQLVGKFDVFEEKSATVNTVAVDRYEVRPINMRDASISKPMWEAYQKEVNANQKIREEKLSQLWERQKIQLENAKKAYQISYDGLKNSQYLKGKKRHDAMLILKNLHEKKLKSIASDAKKQRNEFKKEHKFISYTDWLVKKAMKDDAVALEVLRNSFARNKYHLRHTITANEYDKKQYNALKTGVSKFGEVIYSAGVGEIRDDGKNLNLVNADGADILHALKLSQAKFGRLLTVGGDDDFKANVVKIAVENGLDVAFNDKKMEKIRLDLVRTKQEFDKGVTDKNHSNMLDKANPVSIFIDMRNRMVGKVKDVIKHQLFVSDGEYVYRGQRNVKDAKVALLEKNGVMFVKEISKAEADKFKKTKVGNRVTVGTSIQR